jgi:L-2-hydroxyglutarate oxidase
MAESELACDVAVVGGGLVGLGAAMALAARGDLAVAVLEAEDRLAAHQSGHNSGVIHSGLYYQPGSLKATLCVAGREALYRFCAEEGIAHRRCGKLVVATAAGELPALDELERRGRANGLAGLRRLEGQAAIREVEPHAAGLAALWVPETGIADYPAVARAYGRRVEARGGRVLTGARLLAVRRDGVAGRRDAAGRGGLRLETARGGVVCALLVNCAGLQADRVARLCGARPEARIVPFRGEYWELSAAARERVRGLIYPVPDPRFPFLGVHLTRTVAGQVEAGPNAVLAWKREGYRRGSFAPRDALATLAYPGFWRFAARHWRTGLRELWRSAFPGLLVRDLRRLLPAIAAADLERGGSGVRALELDRRGRLIDDFHILTDGRAVHVLNAPSPAATASIAIGERIAAAAVAALGAAGEPTASPVEGS